LPILAKSKYKVIRADIFGGITAAVVALPLALAFGVASGIGPIAGLYGAIAVGFFAAIFGGTPTQVSGPTGPMTIAMAVIVADHAGNLLEAMAIVFLAGVFQIVFGILKVGRFVSYTPYTVVSGFMSGIGVIIIAMQVLPFFGLPTISGGPTEAMANWPSLLLNMNGDALVLATGSLTIMIFWPATLRPYLPSPLAALVVGTVLGVFVFSGAPVLGEVPTGIPKISFPAFSLESLPGIVQPALVLALLGSIDSLLTSLVADSITHTRHNSNRELIGQGLGNMASALIGGLPGAGATMRTAVNVRAGGQTRISGALHSLILLSLVLGLAPLVAGIPHAVLAGILVKIGWDIIDWGYLKRIKRAPRDKVIVMLITLGLTVFVDLITAVAVGLILAAFATARWMEEEELKGVTNLALAQNNGHLSDEETKALKNYHDSVAIIRLRGRFSYASARELVQKVGADTLESKVILLDFSDAAHMDTSAALAIEEMIEISQSEHSGTFVSGLTGPAENTLKSLGILDSLPPGNIFENRLDAIVAAIKIVK
jgi:SulP family sulfate permease